ncbi:putative RNA-dependent RNA polymerase 2 [Hordeum vulgare]|nr:putative RNA-dependent RNA polymerase 2 [Hordeum vulgare]
MKARSPECLQLATLHLMAVDFAKSGVPVEMPRSPRPKEYPYTDGCFNYMSRSGGWGFVMRNSNGAAVGATAGRLDHAQGTLHTEVEAYSRALHLIQEWGMSRIQIESESQLLIQALNNEDNEMGQCGVLIKEVKVSIFLNFSCFNISFCPRTCNRVADGLAAFGAMLKDVPQIVWPGHTFDFEIASRTTFVVR